MSMTIRQKLAALTITSALAASILGCLGLWGARKIEDTTEQINVGLHAISNHMESDMMHDALRGDVLAALYYAAIAPQRRSELESEARDHAQNFRAKMAANRELEMSAQVRAELAKAEPILELYIDSAERLVSLAFDSHERAAAELAAFSERFSLL